MLTFIALIAALLYVTATAYLLTGLLRHRPLNRLVVMLPGAIALPSHWFLLITHIHGPDGLNLGIFNMVSLMGALVATLTLLMSLYRPVMTLLLGAYPFAFIGLLLATFANAPYTPLQHISSDMELHIFSSILAYSVFSIAAAQALVLAWQDAWLRNHKPLLSGVLPPLVTMERLLFDLIAIGFVLLTGAIATGFWALNDWFAQHVAHKTVFTLLSWAMFACLLIGRHWLGWRGITAIRFTLGGFALLLVGFYGSKAVLELILHKAV